MKSLLRITTSGRPDALTIAKAWQAATELEVGSPESREPDYTGDAVAIAGWWILPIFVLSLLTWVALLWAITN
ncbi:hypothetical protein OU426_17260 [Frigidibacter sp. RF13]|nr:hypothetical protein [Frigidibacter sp. RF13]